MMRATCLLWLLSLFNKLSDRRYVFAFSLNQKSALSDVNRDFAMWIKMHLLKRIVARQILYTKKYARGLETAPVVGDDETGAAVGKHLHWNWIFQNDLLTYVYQSESRGQKAIDSKFPKGLPNSTLVTDRHQSYFKMMLRIIKSVWIISSGMQSI